MKRRYFLGSLGLSILAIKSWAPKLSNQSEAPDQVTLSSGSIFELPANPRSNQKVSFFGSEEWLTEPAVVKRNGHLIMGYDMDLTLDTNEDFSLVYDAKMKSWIFG